jgi:hypothetical protein
MYNLNDPAERERVEKVVYDMVDRGLDMEGSCTVIIPTLFFLWHSLIKYRENTVSDWARKAH